MKAKEHDQRIKEEVYKAYVHWIKNDDHTWIDQLPEYTGLTTRQIDYLIHSLPIYKQNSLHKRRKIKSINEESKPKQFDLFYKLRNKYIKTNKYNRPTNLKEAIESFAKDNGYTKSDVRKWYENKVGGLNFSLTVYL